MTVSRRSFLSLTLSAGLYCSRPIAAAAEPCVPLDAEPLYDGQLHPHELAMFIARCELDATKQAHPHTWRELRYVRSIPWSETITITYGWGDPDTAKHDYLAAWLLIEAGLPVLEGPKADFPRPNDGQRIISRHVTPCGWAWAIAVERMTPNE